MNNRSKNNSIIFLTTLSVYLGLVLVSGATPSVLAQAATTRNFNVQDEVEVKDDLDKKPDNDFPFLFVQLLSEIKPEVENRKISPPIQTSFVIDQTFRLPGTYIGTSRWTSFSDEDFGKFLEEAVNRKFVSKINETADYYDEESNFGQIRLEADGNNLSLKISFKKLNAEVFTESLNQKFSLFVVSSEDVLTRQVYQNTKVTFENNQVFIVTRLPRGSLDALLKQDAKAENQ